MAEVRRQGREKADMIEAVNLGMAGGEEVKKHVRELKDG